MGRGTTLLRHLGVMLAAVCVGARAAHATCVGDCFENEDVTVDELVLGIDIVLGKPTAHECPWFEPADDDELLLALENALYGCGPVTPTLTATASATRTATTTPLSKGALRAVSTPGPNAVVAVAARQGVAAGDFDATRSPFFLCLSAAGLNLAGLLLLYRRQRC